MEKCKYCRRKGTYSFGWLNTAGEWRDKHLTCDKHALVSSAQQDFAMGMEQMRERHQMLFTRPVVFINGNP